ncbi:hypothetical protein BWQ96_05935 [Gracilariopsis chorda]|uniref:Uncharacterized protein n=1 Tax=Gracilariopsis chorda TaxID=448386 RepID=A0A2V3IQE4_9FLOR|nr:hypothetical protein BWQ96_05935 [Gracilariopsis chorda]|eukprot:PXF44308.1 hypothetical protein BWQ96_05935 [Gracilariopsis chorda]
MLAVDPAHRFDSFQVLEEVNRILGRQRDPQLMNVGNELRAKRCEDFGIDSNAASATTYSKPALRLNETAAHAPTQPLSQSLLGNFDELLSVTGCPHGKPDCPVSESNATPTSMENSDWADFDSAFGKPSIVSASTTVSTESPNAFSSDCANCAPSHTPHRARSSIEASMQQNAGVE